MAKKKKRQQQDVETHTPLASVPVTSPPPSTQTNGKPKVSEQPSTSALIICRNKYVDAEACGLHSGPVWPSLVADR